MMAVDLVRNFGWTELGNDLSVEYLEIVHWNYISVNEYFISPDA
jgi:hypothetical protein